MSAWQKSEAAKSQKEILALSVQVNELKARLTAPPPPALPEAPPLLQQIAQLMQSNDMLSLLKRNIRDEVIRPGLDEHRVKIEEARQKHEAVITEHLITKVDKANDTMFAMSRWADKLKKDVDPGLLLPSANAQPTTLSAASAPPPVGPS